MKPRPLPIAAQVRRLRFHDTAPPRGVLGVSVVAALGQGSLEDGDALWIAPAKGFDPDDPLSLAQRVPEPPPARRVWAVMGPGLGNRGLLDRLLGREVRLDAAVRGSALLLRGWRAVAAGVDVESGLELVWAEAP